MAIHLRTGDPRQGKSYSNVESIILPAAIKGLVVWTNIPLKLQSWYLLKGDNPELLVPVQFHIKDIVNNVNWFLDVLPKGALLVLDEVTRLWPSGITQKEMKLPHMEFLTMHGHRVSEKGIATNIVLICQNSGQLAKCVRDLVEEHGIVTKLDYVGLPGHFGLDVYRKTQNDQYPNEKSLIGQSEHKFKESTYALYISQTQSDVSFSGIENASLKRKTIWTKKLLFQVLFCPLIFVFTLGYGCVKVSGFIDKNNGVENDVEDQNQNVVVVSSDVNFSLRRLAQIRQENLKFEVRKLELKKELVEEEKKILDEKREYERTKYSAVWRIIGFSKSSKSLTVFVTDGRTYRRISGDDCDFDFEIVCVIDDGKVVTRWTGRKPGAKLEFVKF